MARRTVVPAANVRKGPGKVGKDGLIKNTQPTQVVAIVGPGRVGQAMGRLLAQREVRVEYIAARKLIKARRAARVIGRGRPVKLDDPGLLSASIVLITTNDAAIAKVAGELSRIEKGTDAWKGKVVLHTCGSLPSDVLRPLKLQGAAIGSMHPYQTVPSPQAGVRNLPGTFWGIEGDPPAVRVARDWIKRLKGVAFSVPPKGKSLYHLSAFLVCPALVTIMAQSEALLRSAGIPAKTSRPMLRQFVTETANNFAEMGAQRALTGPAVRGDWATIRRHLAALRRASPEFVPVYRSLLKAMLRLAAKSPK